MSQGDEHGTSEEKNSGEESSEEKNYSEEEGRSKEWTKMSWLNIG